MKHYSTVDVYNDDGHFITEVILQHKWQALLFHWLLNSSVYNRGVRKY